MSIELELLLKDAAEQMFETLTIDELPFMKAERVQKHHIAMRVISGDETPAGREVARAYADEEGGESLSVIQWAKDLAAEKFYYIQVIKALNDFYRAALGTIQVTPLDDLTEVIDTTLMPVAVAGIAELTEDTTKSDIISAHLKRWRDDTVAAIELSLNPPVFEDMPVMGEDE